MPDMDREALRDLVRLRCVARQMVRKACQHLQGFLLRLGMSAALLTSPLSGQRPPSVVASPANCQDRWEASKSFSLDAHYKARLPEFGLS
jgi:hypothetical protein